MRVIVTGASSFMGLAAVRELGMLGIQTEAVIRPSSPARGALEEMEHVRVRPCLLEEIRFLAEKTGLKEADAWLHLFVQPTPGNPWSIHPLLPFYAIV